MEITKSTCAEIANQIFDGLERQRGCFHPNDRDELVRRYTQVLQRERDAATKAILELHDHKNLTNEAIALLALINENQTDPDRYEDAWNAFDTKAEAMGYVL